MSRYILKRLGLTVITLVIVSFVVFAASQLLPGDVGRTILGPYASQQQVDALDKSLGNDKPLPVRYWNWASDFVRGDWGVSPVQNVEVRPLVLHRTLRLSCRLWLFFAGAENALFTAANAFVRVQAFQNELRRRYLLLGGVLWADIHFHGFIHQPLDTPEQ